MYRSILFSTLLVLSLSLSAYSAECPVIDRMGGTYALSVLSSDTGFTGDEEGTGAYMGVDISDITPERVGALKLKDERGVEVTIVDQDAPAGKAGIKEHDVILTMNGMAVESGAQLRRMIRETPAGRVVSLGISRDGQPLTITPQLGEFFGVKNGKGVLVRSVEKGSRAEKSGFRAGDVIVRVNDQPVQDTSDFSHAIRSTTTDSVTIGVVRDKHELNLTLSLPPHKTSGDVWEESFDDSDFNAESFVDLGELRDEWAQMQPQMQFAMDESRHALEQVKPEIDKAKREAVEEIERAKPEVERALREAQAATERAQQELCSQQKELRRQTEKLKKEIQKQQRSLMQEKRKQMERLRHEMRGEWTQI